MKPYGFETVGAHAWVVSEQPAKPHQEAAQHSEEVNRNAGRRRPKRAERQRARREILANMDET
jgi:hypothetical protein